MKIVSVYAPVNFANELSYHVPDGFRPVRGDIVRVPLRGGETFGAVRNVTLSDGKEKYKLKEISEVYSHGRFSEEHLNFIEKFADYTLAPQGEAVKASLADFTPAPAFAKEIVLRFNPAAPDFRMTTERAKILHIFKERPAGISRFEALTYTSATILSGLLKANVLESLTLEKTEIFKTPNPDFMQVTLNTEQQQAKIGVTNTLDHFTPFLLDGVTGSGKTEVMFEIIAELLRKDPTAQILILSPEIALTSQMAYRFEQRFGVPPILRHSGLGEAERKRGRYAVAAGTARAVIGARSGLFLPFQNLRLIIVDEEHDCAYKQEEGMRYHARDMAVLRAKCADCPILLASATPSLESWVNAETERYQKLTLTSRHGKAKKPTVTAIDMRHENCKGGGKISPTLQRVMRETLDRDEQVLLFLNRRGYAPLTLCRGCGDRLKCPHCDAWPVFHKSAKNLKCHLCGQKSEMPEICSACGAEGKFVTCGEGIEKLAEETEALFPNEKPLIFSSDHIDNPDKLNELLQSARDGSARILIGTQLIAKGHHFPNLTCAGVIDADYGTMTGADIRASERAFQLLEQVSGRAGRAEKPGFVYLQTYNPDNPIISALLRQDRDFFLNTEANERMHAGHPPFGRFAAVILSGTDLKILEDFARQFAGRKPETDSVIVYGPAPAPIARLNNRHRIRFLIKTDRKLSIQKFMRQWLGNLKPPASVRLVTDIDPINFM